MRRTNSPDIFSLSSNNRTSYYESTLTNALLQAWTNRLSNTISFIKRQSPFDSLRFIYFTSPIAYNHHPKTNISKFRPILISSVMCDSARHLLFNFVFNFFSSVGIQNYKTENQNYSQPHHLFVINVHYHCRSQHHCNRLISAKTTATNMYSISKRN